MSEQIDIELKKEFKKSCFYKKYSVENKYYVDSVLKHIFKEDIEKKEENKGSGRVANCKIEGSKNNKSATYEQVVEQNCKVIGDYIECFIIPFKEDHNYNKYKRQIENMITDGKGNGIYIDPDSKFNNEEIKDKGFENIIFSYDGLISINNILDFNEGILLDKDKFIDEYKLCRKNPIFFFPVEKESINKMRNACFKDRIDYALFDIKNYLDGKESKMKEIYENGDTKKWLDIVKDKGGFDYLVKLYDINDIFVVKVKDGDDYKYKILDIEKKDGNSFIEKYREEKNYNWTSDYYINLKSLISKYNGRLK